MLSEICSCDPNAFVGLWSWNIAAGWKVWHWYFESERVRIRTRFECHVVEVLPLGERFDTGVKKQFWECGWDEIILEAILFDIAILWACRRKTSASSNRITETSSSRWFVGLLSSTICFLRTDLVLPQSIYLYFQSYFCLVNSQESLAISVLDFVEIDLNF